MNSNIIKNVLFSVALHGVVLACCFAVPAQKLIPVFQAGNSSLTLTSLAVSLPDGDQSSTKIAVQKQENEASRGKPRGIVAEPCEAKDAILSAIADSATEDPPCGKPQGRLAKKGENEDSEDAAEIEDNEENSPDDLPDIPIPDKKPASTSTQKPQNPGMPTDADAQIKGISGGLAGNSAIRPYYPLGARLRGEEGVVKIEVCVGVNGHALNCAVVKSSGFLALDDAALVAVKRARFVTASGTAPAKDSKTVLTFRFDLVD